MILWTRQVPEVWEELQTSGIYRVKEEYIRQKNGEITDFYLDLYRWYTREAKKYATIPQDAMYPIWLSVDEKMMLRPVEETIILKIEVPDENVLICNMDAWGYRVNYWYVPVDEEDARRHAEELKRYGIREEDELIATSKGNFYPIQKQKIMKSWNRVFMPELESCKERAATIWEIRREWVKEIWR